MRIYVDPITTTSLPLLLFAAEHGHPLQVTPIRLFDGEHLSARYRAVNPNRCVPALQDDDFVLTECSAILKYLADKLHSATYPRELRARARVNQLMDWFNTGFYRDLGYGVVYPRVLRQYAFDNPATQADFVRRGERSASKWLAILDEHWLREPGFLCGAGISIADYLGSSYVAITDLVGFDLTPYPNVRRWMGTMQARPAWNEVRREWNAFRASLSAPSASASVG